MWDGVSWTTVRIHLLCPSSELCWCPYLSSMFHFRLHGHPYTQGLYIGFPFVWPNVIPNKSNMWDDSSAIFLVKRSTLIPDFHWRFTKSSIFSQEMPYLLGNPVERLNLQIIRWFFDWLNFLFRLSYFSAVSIELTHFDFNCHSLSTIAQKPASLLI
jgi:hypothetical protein